MSLFGAEVVRLLRESWPNATLLAEELYAILQGDIPITQQAPTDLTNPGDQSPLTITTNPQGDGIQFVKDGVPSGGFFVRNKKLFIQLHGKLPTRDNPNPGGLLTLSGGGVPGQVQTPVSGQVYNVDLYENGTSAPSTQTVQVTQLQIASGETIPQGTWALVSNVIDDNGNVLQYVMQVPVWVS